MTETDIAALLDRIEKLEAALHEIAARYYTHWTNCPYCGGLSVVDGLVMHHDDCPVSSARRALGD